jgi:hypothetical protein
MYSMHMIEDDKRVVRSIEEMTEEAEIMKQYFKD